MLIELHLPLPKAVFEVVFRLISTELLDGNLHLYQVASMEEVACTAQAVPRQF